MLCRHVSKPPFPYARSAFLQAVDLASQLTAARDDLGNSQMLSGQQALQLHQQEQQLAAAAEQNTALQQQLQAASQQVRLLYSTCASC